MKADFVSSVESEVKALLKKEKQKAPTLEAKQLIGRIEKLVMRGGKRFRPQLLQLTYEAYRGSKKDELVDQAVGLELHHQFLLIHDDIIDQDNQRYFGPNIIGYYQKEYGFKQYIPESMALLAGDLVFSFANKAILNSNSYTPEQKIELLKLLQDTNAKTIYGEQLDTFNFLTNDTKLGDEKYELISSLKTAAYSTMLPMQSAAILLNLGQNERNKIDKFALSFGILFQLVDDYSDYFENKSLLNDRQKYRDLRQGKFTYPMYITINLATKAEVDYMHRVLGKKDLPDKDIEKVLKLMNKYGAKVESQKYLEKYINSTRSALDKLSIRSDLKQRFIGMIENYSL